MKHIVGFSGGIDSQACARWVLNRFPKEDVILTNSNAGGNEHPMTVAFIDWYSETIHPVQRVDSLVCDMGNRADAEIKARGLKDRDPLTFDLLAELKQTFPRRMMQFCTEHLKLLPQKRWISENITDEYIRYNGVRRDESQNRSNVAMEEYDTIFECQLVRPIFDWTKQMCFDFVKAHGEQINPLYTLGFDRVGCAPCVNSGKDDIRAWAERFPEMIDKVRDWEKKVGKSFFGALTPKACAASKEYKEAVQLWRIECVYNDENGIANAPRPVRPPETINWIDDVVRWSKTVRGGKQFQILYPREACESSHGLCE